MRLDVDALEAEVDRAVALFRTGRPAQAVRSLAAVRRQAERKLARDGRDPAATALVARTLMSESAPRFDLTGDLELALGLLSRADGLAAEANSATLRATILGQRALVVLRSGDTRAALRAFDEAAALMELVPVRDRAIIMLNRGALHLEHAELAGAAEDLRTSVRLCDEAGDARLGAMARHNFGYVDFLAGRLPKALAVMEEAQRLSPDEPHPTALLDRARVLREAGLVRDAEAILEQASALFQTSGLQQDLAETELVRAECALVEGDSRRARSLAASAYRRFVRRGNVRWQRKAELLLLRCERATVGDRRRAGAALAAVAARAERLAEACRQEGRRELARSAALLAQQCRLTRGEPLAGPPPAVRRTDPLQLRLQTAEVRALRAVQAGDTTRAAAEVRRGLGELGSYQHSFGSLDLRTASAVHGSALAQLGLDVALRTGSPAAVVNLVEHSRAVSTRLPSVRPPRDDLTAELLSELRRVEEEARALEGEPAAEGVLHELRAQATTLQRRIRARAWEVEGERGEAAAAPRSSRLSDAAREAGVVFVSLARHQGRWVAVSIGPNRCRLHSLAPVAEVSRLVHRVRADLDALAMPVLPPPLREAMRRSLDLGLRRLDELLLGPLRLGDRPSVLSCSGELMFLPWGLLPSRAGISTVVTPSAAGWLAGRTGDRPTRPRVVTVAGPELRCAGQEAELVGGAWDRATVLAGEAASAAATQDALVSADLVHVAAHGVHRHDNPLFSSVRMADGHLYAYEIDSGEGIAGCVVLSACEAGLATLRPGDESLGLAHVLLQLGTSSVIAGVARVGDDDSARLMQRMHLSMARGTDAASALAEAQRSSLDGPSPAGFVTFGATW